MQSNYNNWFQWGSGDNLWTVNSGSEGAAASCIHCGQSERSTVEANNVPCSSSVVSVDTTSKYVVIYSVHAARKPPASALALVGPRYIVILSTVRNSSTVKRCRSTVRSFHCIANSYSSNVNIVVLSSLPLELCSARYSYFNKKTEK